MSTPRCNDSVICEGQIAAIGESTREHARTRFNRRQLAEKARLICNARQVSKQPWILPSWRLNCQQPLPTHAHPTSLLLSASHFSHSSVQPPWLLCYQDASWNDTPGSLPVRLAQTYCAFLYGYRSNEVGQSLYAQSTVAGTSLSSVSSRRCRLSPSQLTHATATLSLACDTSTPPSDSPRPLRKA